MSSLTPQPPSAAARPTTIHVRIASLLSDGRGPPGASTSAIDGVDDLVDVGGVARPAVQLEVPGDVGGQARLGALRGIAEAVEQGGPLFQLAPVHLVTSLVVVLALRRRHPVE